MLDIFRRKIPAHGVGGSGRKRVEKKEKDFPSPQMENTDAVGERTKNKNGSSRGI